MLLLVAQDLCVMSGARNAAEETQRNSHTDFLENTLIHSRHSLAAQSGCVTVTALDDTYMLYMQLKKMPPVLEFNSN